MDVTPGRVPGPGPEALGPILSDFLARSGVLRPRAVRRLAAAWRQAAGSDTAAHTRVVGLRKNVLEVEVDSAARLHELANFHKPGILARLAEALCGAAAPGGEPSAPVGGCATYIRDIRFRQGALGA